ncbi:hypothetical protein BDW42DRAFT_163980, partial [Aspergillus taichungensis]
MEEIFPCSVLVRSTCMAFRVPGFLGVSCEMGEAKRVDRRPPRGLFFILYFVFILFSILFSIIFSLRFPKLFLFFFSSTLMWTHSCRIRPACRRHILQQEQIHV